MARRFMHHDPSHVVVDEVVIHDFGVLDKKHRRVGCRITTDEADGKFGWLASVLRDGSDFGPITGAGGWHETREDRQAAIDRYLRGARRRAEKAHGVAK